MDRAAHWVRDGQFGGRIAGSSATDSEPISPLEAPPPVVSAAGVRPFTPEPRHSRQPHHAKSEPALRHSNSHQRNPSGSHGPRPQKSESSIRFHDPAPTSDHRRHHSRGRSIPANPYVRHKFSSGTLAPSSGSMTRDGSTTDLYPAPSSTYSEHKKRMLTNLGEPEDAPIETRHTHDYFFRRPRPLLVEHRGHLLAVGEGEKIDVENPESMYHLDVKSNPKHAHSEHHPDSLHKQRERLDIFVDLIWVGIIANIAEHFHARVFTREDNPGVALGEFILLFLPAWRVWISLQSWLNSYYTDDYFQRIFVAWILILGVIWGNNGPYLLVDLGASNLENWTIISFIIAMASFGIMQGIYAHWLPWLRRYMLISWISSIPGIGLWIAAATVPPSTLKYILVSCAIAYNAVEFIFLSTPWADRLLGNGIRRAQDSRTMIRRYENFFIIALGEGVFLLIRSSPLVIPSAGFISIHLGRGIIVLLLFYVFNWVYFHGDMSKRYIHAMDRRWWIKFLWQVAHIPLFAALVILSSGTLFLVMFPTQVNPDGSSSYDYPYRFLYGTEYSKRDLGVDESSLHEFVARAASPSQKYNANTFSTGKITTCVCVAVSLASQLGLALLNRPVDHEHALRVSNRWIRMAPRAIATLVTSVVWLAPGLNDPTAVLGLCLGIVFLVAVAEQLLGMPLEARIFEPKEAGVRAVMSRTYESRGSSQTRL